jgi:hypothetical protein
MSLNHLDTIECKARSEDGYPAGLRLACDLWGAIETEQNSGIQVKGIRGFWDGVNLEGVFRKHEFEVGLNYATEDVVLLTVRIRSKFFDKNKSTDELSAALRARLEHLISAMPGRALERSP